jgi:hypothetical protein
MPVYGYLDFMLGISTPDGARYRRRRLTSMKRPRSRIERTVEPPIDMPMMGPRPSPVLGEVESDAGVAVGEVSAAGEAVTVAELYKRKPVSIAHPKTDEKHKG